MKSIQIIVVLYETKIADSCACRTLEPYLKTLPIDLLLYDHSAQSQTHALQQHPAVTYVHDPRNLGLATAYNAALARAQEKQRDYLVLFDQDTACPDGYLSFLVHDADFKAVGIVPIVKDAGRQISPVFADTYIDHTMRFPETGCTKKRIMAINSGTCWSCTFLTQIGGFNLDFPLDFLDHWLWLEVYRTQNQCQIVPFTLTHSLSVLDYHTVSLARYRSILASEHRYYQQYEPTLYKRHQKQLYLRAIKQFLTVSNRRIWKETVKQLWGKGGIK